MLTKRFVSAMIDASPIAPWLGTTRAGASAVRRSWLAIHCDRLAPAPTAGSSFMATSPENSTLSGSTKVAVSPRVWLKPMARNRTVTPPRSSVCSFSKVMSALRNSAPCSSSAWSGEMPAKRFAISRPEAAISST